MSGRGAAAHMTRTSYKIIRYRLCVMQQDQTHTMAYGENLCHNRKQSQCNQGSTAVLALASEVRARINVVFKMTAVTTASETNTVNI